MKISTSLPYEGPVNTGLSEEYVRKIYETKIKGWRHFKYKVGYYTLTKTIVPGVGVYENYHYFYLKKEQRIIFMCQTRFINYEYESVFAWRNKDFPTQGLLNLLYSKLLLKHNILSSRPVSPDGKRFWINFSKDKTFYLRNIKTKIDTYLPIKDCFKKDRDFMYTYICFPKNEV